MNTDYTVIIEKGDGGYLIGTVVELPGCHTQAKNMSELLENIKEAVELYVETEGPERKTEFLGIQRISL